MSFINNNLIVDFILLTSCHRERRCCDDKNWSKTLINSRCQCHVTATSLRRQKFAEIFNTITISLQSHSRQRFRHHSDVSATDFRRHCDLAATSKIDRYLWPIFDVPSTSLHRRRDIERLPTFADNLWRHSKDSAMLEISRNFRNIFRRHNDDAVASKLVEKLDYLLQKGFYDI